MTKPTCRVALYIQNSDIHKENHNIASKNTHNLFSLQDDAKQDEGAFKNLSDGYYQIRLLGKMEELICTSEPVLIGTSVPMEATISGRNIIVTWKADLSNTSKTAWIGVFLKAGFVVFLLD